MILCKCSYGLRTENILNACGIPLANATAIRDNGLARRIILESEYR